MSIIKKAITGKIFSALLASKNSHLNGNNSGSVLSTIAKETPFVILAIFAIIVYAIFGIYEVLFNSPLSDWAANFWNSLMSTSPQTIIDIPKQIPSENSLMQKTVSDWLEFIPLLASDILSVVFAPIASILGIIIVFVAIAVRLGKHILGLFSSGTLGRNSANVISWALLVFSLVPLLAEYL